MKTLSFVSDGLHNMLDGKKLLKVLSEKVDIEYKINLLKDKALSNGGLDNITVILLEK